MKQFERTEEEPYYPEDDMTDEEYEAYCDRADMAIGEIDEHIDRMRKKRKEEEI